MDDSAALERRREINRRSARKSRSRQKTQAIQSRKLYYEEQCKNTKLIYEKNQLMKEKETLLAQIEEHKKVCTRSQSSLNTDIYALEHSELSPAFSYMGPHSVRLTDDYLTGNRISRSFSCPIEDSEAADIEMTKYKISSSSSSSSISSFVRYHSYDNHNNYYDTLESDSLMGGNDIFDDLFTPSSARESTNSRCQIGMYDSSLVGNPTWEIPISESSDSALFSQSADILNDIYEEIPQHISEFVTDNNIPSGSCSGIPPESYSDMPQNCYSSNPLESYSGIRPDSYSDILPGSFSDIPTDSYNDMRPESFNDIPSDSYTDMPPGSCSGVPPGSCSELLSPLESAQPLDLSSTGGTAKVTTGECNQGNIPLHVAKLSLTE